VVAPYVAVVAGGHVDDDLVAFGRDVGRGIAEAGAVLICGGLGDILTATMQGATEAGGTTVAVLPGLNRDGLTAEPTVAMTTGLGEARNVLIARSCHAMIAIGGGYGTLSEIALAARTGTSIVGYRTWKLQPPGAEEFEDPIIPATTADDAVTMAIGLTQA
jgi:uncharacterized protein (TIGR00725 family)